MKAWEARWCSGDVTLGVKAEGKVVQYTPRSHQRVSRLCPYSCVSYSPHTLGSSSSHSWTVCFSSDHSPHPQMLLSSREKFPRLRIYGLVLRLLP